MKRILLVFGTVSLIAGSTSGIAFAGGAQAASGPTFNKDVAPILHSNCAICHRPGEVAPMSLLSYKDARPWARAIKSKVVAREMPPWGADPQFGKFRNAPRITQAQIDTIVAWVDAGAPQGAGSPPAEPVFADHTNGFMGRPPDYVAQMPVEIDIPVSGELPNFDVYSRVPFAEDKFAAALELRPSNRAVTHHSSVRSQQLPPGTILGTGPAWPGGQVVTNAVAVPDRAQTDAAGRTRNTGPAARPADEFIGEGTFENLLELYVPGGGFQQFRPGIVKRIRHSDYLLWRLHYTPIGKAEKDRHSLGIWFENSPITHEVVTTSVNDVNIVEGKELFAEPGQRQVPRPTIPAFADNWRIEGVKAFPTAVTISGMWPHMHLRGKDMKYIVTYPDGREETILNVPKYQFEWQFQYEFIEPLRLPAGTVMRVVAHYDNSPKNRINPSPDQEVFWGEQSWEEMFFPFLELSIDKNVLTATQPQTERQQAPQPSGGGGR